jgi:hypothetical protein
MISDLREAYNRDFTPEKYHEFLNDLNSGYPGAIEFRVAETPLFIPKRFTQKMMDACEFILDFIDDSHFKELTQRAIPLNENVPNENNHADCIAFDFGICQNEKGEPEPRLIEMQGFPSLFGFQVYYPRVLERHFSIPAGFSHYLNGYNDESYLDFLKEMIVGNHEPENVILLEIKPHQQKTRIDFYCTANYLNIPIVCLTELLSEGSKLYYKKGGKKIPVKRIYNRIIFDELHNMRKDLGEVVDITRSYDVEWVPHPNWFYRVSKFTLPFLKHPYIPESYFLNEVKQLPGDLGNFVLKPLFSFAGQGVIIDVTPEDIVKVADPENWILQQKVKYADIIKTPDIPAKAEIRLFYLRKSGMARPIALTNLARLSKGKMIGVRYNMDKEWVGASFCYFEP